MNHISTRNLRVFTVLGAALLALLISSPSPAAAPTGTISVTPATGTVPYQATLAWNVAGAGSCSASGAWSGAKPASGSVSITVTAANQKYQLDCAEPVQTATVSWDPATKNTDGSALTPTGYKLQESIDGASWRNDTSVAGNVTSYAFAGLSPGTHYFQIATVAGSVSSAWTAPVSTVIPTPLTASFSATPGTVAVPNPPTNVRVTVAVLAYELRQYSNGTLRFVQVGTVPLGKECGTALVGDYAVFDGATITKPTTGGVIAARCGS